MKKRIITIVIVLVISLLVTACSHEHSYGEWIITKEATCTEDGIQERTCEKNDDTQTETIPATGHSYGEWVVTKEAACTEDGIQERTCEKNDDTQTETIPATGHSFDEWEVVKDPTCQAEGEQKRVCSKCGAEETEAIPIVEHSFGDWEITKEATCTEDGEQTRTCQMCGMEEKETIPATGHEFEEATYFKPRTCKKCGETDGEALATVVKIGDEGKGEDYSFTVTDTYFATKVSDYLGNTKYTSVEGNYFVIQLSFTNLAKESYPVWYSDRASRMTLIFDNQYEYSGESNAITDEIIPLETQNLYLMYSVPEIVETDTSKSIMTTFAFDGDVYAMIIREGKENKSESEYESTSSVDNNTEKIINIGDTRTDGDNYLFEVLDVFYADKVSDTYDNVTYSSQEGNFLVIKLKFTNLSKDDFSIWNSDRLYNLNLKYNDKYDYKGQFFGGNDVLPLETDNIYIMYGIVDAVKKDDISPIMATFELDGSVYEIDCRANLK